MTSENKKNAQGTAIPRASKYKILYTHSLSDSPLKVKRKTSSKTLTGFQKHEILKVWRTSRTGDEALARLRQLDFCTLEAAADVLLEQGFIGREDYYHIFEVQNDGQN